MFLRTSMIDHEIRTNLCLSLIEYVVCDTCKTLAHSFGQQKFSNKKLAKILGEKESLVKKTREGLIKKGLLKRGQVKPTERFLKEFWF